MSTSLQELKKRFLRLLDEDVEFRYTVAGYLGLSEILKRLDGIEEEQVRLREEQAKMREEQIRMREEFSKRFEAHEAEMRALREDFNKRFEAHEAELRALREDFNRMQKTIEDVQKTIADMQKTIADMQETIASMQLTIEGMLRAIERMDKRLTRVEKTLEKLTIDIEEEARSIVAHRLRQMGYDIELDRLQLPGVELDLYGAIDDMCVVGECGVRAGPSLLEELKHKLETLKKLYPSLLRPKTILVIYASLALPELVESAKRERVWVLKATKDVVPPPLP